MGKWSAITPSTEASLSENSWDGSHTPPKDRGALRESNTIEAMPQASGIKKRTRRSNRRKNTTEVVSKIAESNQCPAVEERSISRREVVTVSDLCFDFGPSLVSSVGGSGKVAPTLTADKMTEEFAPGPISPCRARRGPAGIVSTNPCTDVTPTIAPASTRIPDQSRSRFCSLAQAAPMTLDLRLCAGAAPDTTQAATVHEGLLGSPCKGRACSISGSMNIVSATPCNTPTATVIATPCSSPTGVVSSTSCTRHADASARTPLAAVRGAPLSSGLATSAQVTSTAPDAFTLGMEPGPFSPLCPRALFPSGVVNTVPEQSELRLPSKMPNSCSGSSAGTVVADAMRSWLQSSGLPSGSQALEAELRAAVPEAYED